MNRTILIIIIALCTSSLFAQIEKKVVIDYQFVEAQNKDGFTLTFVTFDDAQRMRSTSSLPIYTAIFEKPDELFGYDVDIVEILADTFSLKKSLAIADNDLITSEYKTFVAYKGSDAQLSVFPMKRDLVTNRIIALTKFDIIAHIIPVAPSKLEKSFSHTYANSSVLSEGTWIKMGVTERGIHKLTYSDIEKMGFSPEQLDMKTIGVFGNYNGLLPESNSKPKIDDLQENSIFISDGGDGSFNTDDYILFYAQSPTTWTYNPFTGRFFHSTNIYADTVCYFFTTDRGSAKQIQEVDGTINNPTRYCSEFTDFMVHDKEDVNLISSGKKWYGEKFYGDTLSREFYFNIPDLNDDEPIYVGIELVGRAFSDSYYDVYVNDQLVSDSSKIRYVTTGGGIYARESSTDLTCYPGSEDVTVRIVYYSDDENAAAWLDYIEVNALRNLEFSGNQMVYSNPRFSASGNITEYSISNTNDGDMVWEITDIHNPRLVKSSYDNGVISYTLPTDSLLTFVISNGEEYYSPVEYISVQNQNLHAISNVNFVVIRPDNFSAEAERLADIHRTNDNMSVVTVSPQQIYNEFSSGSQDISAIRNFMKMLYDKGAFNNERIYLLLFGDASFDYKHRIHENTNIVPTYESEESLRETGSFVTDDYFGLLDDDEGANVDGELDVGIGRFPVSTIEQAEIAVNKIEAYLQRDKKVMRDWRRSICFVADDMDNNLHFNQAEGLASIADTLLSGIAINKIYSDAFKIETVPGGTRYPEVNYKISDQVNDGALIVNYTGHGGLIGWSDEHILDVPMINSYTNIDNMPLVITATCEFSRFDDPELTSAGEYFYINETGGAIALLTTTRVAYAHANYVVNRRIYFNLIKCEDGLTSRLGDLVRLSKIPSHENYLNFVLLGDPALTLAYPDYQVVTKIDSASIINDTVKALTLVNVVGEIVDKQNNRVENFNGILYPKVIDKAGVYSTLGNQGNSYPAEFELYNKFLFEGKISITEGEFSFDFMVPKDISYNYGFGRIDYYALDTVNYVDAWGSYEELLLGGLNNDAIIDDHGPEIDLYMNDNTFTSGDVVTSNSVLLAFLSDDNGVNCTGNGIGRDIVMTIDKNSANPIILNGYYDVELNSYTSGKIVYPFENLSEGLHVLTIKAWDLQNNSTEETIEFTVDNNANIKLFDVKCVPNPFVGSTSFEFKHNKSGSSFRTFVRIFDSDGNFVVELSTGEEYSETGYLLWDGTNAFGSVVDPGMYVYTIEVIDNYGNISIQQQKIIKINR